MNERPHSVCAVQHLISVRAHLACDRASGSVPTGAAWAAASAMPCAMMMLVALVDCCEAKREAVVGMAVDGAQSRTCKTRDARIV